MDQIYSTSLPSDLSSDILGESGTQQVVKNIQGLRLLAALPGPVETIAQSTWDTRAWTLQEAELSHASVILGKYQASFRCAQEVFREDLVTDITDEGYHEIKATDLPWLHLENEQKKTAPSRNNSWHLIYHMYGRIVESYTKRVMTHSIDILSAFQGICNVLYALRGWRMLNGLVEDLIDYSLLWRPQGYIHRRFQDQRIPTYSWSAWIGPVTYRPYQRNPRSYTVHSLIRRFWVFETSQKKRQVFRFSQVASDECGNGIVLKPPPACAPQDCSMDEEHKYKKQVQWLKPQVYNLAYRCHVAKHPYNYNKNGPCVLHFEATCIQLLLTISTAIPVYPKKTHSILLAGDPEPEKDWIRVWLLNEERLKVGTVWYTPDLEEYDQRVVEVILLSTSRSNSLNDSWQFDKQ
ncbi:MAG: hypothetical protein Q9220_002212, partial [cf. Caloplaca sp. 1 TL-2023]